MVVVVESVCERVDRSSTLVAAENEAMSFESRVTACLDSRKRSSSQLSEPLTTASHCASSGVEHSTFHSYNET